MTTQLNSERVEAPPAVGLRNLARALAPQDWLMFCYLLFITLAALSADAHPARLKCSVRMGGLWLAFTTVTALVRSGAWPQRPLGPLVYRVAIFLLLLVSYLFLDDFLPLVNPNNLDAELHAIDLALFRFEPAVTLDRFVTPFATEWFAFFYFSYFYLVTAHIFPIAFYVRNERLLGEFGVGLLLLYTIGQTLYMFVPGFGPVVALAHEFTHPLPSGFWLNAVRTTVQSGGAHKDIFPSLHTAAPTFLALLSYRHRHLRGFRYTWPVLAFFALNIVGATLYLRWHWLIDVVAGLILAVACLKLSAWLTEHELKRRARLGLGHSWCELHAR